MYNQSFVERSVVLHVALASTALIRETLGFQARTAWKLDLVWGLLISSKIMITDLS